MKYGWIPDVPDKNDKHFTPPRMMDLPPGVDLRENFPEAFSQGMIGSCTAQVLSAVVQFGHLRHKRHPLPVPSRLFIYYNARCLMGTQNTDSGASMRTAIKSLTQYGFCREDMWPYVEEKYKNKPTREAFRYGQTNKVQGAYRVDQDLTVFKNTLASLNPIAFGFSVYEGFEGPDVRRTGILPMPTDDQQMIGGHAVCAVGYDDSKAAFLVRNSWGPGWGDGGHFWMPYDYITDPNLAADFWVVPT